MAACGPHALGRMLVALCALAVPATAAEPAAPSAGLLAFVAAAGGRQDLYVIDTARRTVRRLTTGHRRIDDAAWSPDGARLAFTSTFGQAPAIFVVNRDGTGVRRLAAGRSPAWSPDGARIAYAAIEDGNEDVYVLDPASAQRRRLTTHPGRDFSPQWAPDGARLAFASSRSESSRLAGLEYGSEIHLMSADGSGVRALTGHNACGLANESEGKLNAPGAWTPDGRRLLYRAGVCKFDCRVCVIEVAEGRVHPLVGERMVTAFSLAPDGGSVAYAWDHRLFVIDLGAAAGRELVRDAWGPAWSPDGSRIAFLVEADPGAGSRRSHIEMIDPAGGGRQRLTTRPGEYWGLAWSPAGTR